MTTPSDHVMLRGHALKRVIERFAPADPQAFAAELLAESAVVGVDRRGHHVLAGDRAVIIAKQEGLSTLIVSVMPAGWPADIVGQEYRPTANPPATPASIAALAARFGR